MSLNNPTMAGHAFLKEMYRDDYFPDAVVDQGKAILVELCQQIEAQKPADLAALYELTHAATERFNDLQEVFEANGSEIETAARESIADDFARIARAYGFADADIEDLIATRDW